MIAAVSFQPPTASPLLPAPASPGFAGLLADQMPAAATAPMPGEGDETGSTVDTERDGDDDVALPLMGIVTATLIPPPAEPPASTDDATAPSAVSPRSDPDGPRPHADDPTVVAVEHPPLPAQLDQAATRRPDGSSGERHHIDGTSAPTDATAAPRDPGTGQDGAQPVPRLPPEEPSSPPPTSAMESMRGLARSIATPVPVGSEPIATSVNTSHVPAVPSVERPVAAPAARSVIAVAPLLAGASDNGPSDGASPEPRGDRRDDVGRSALPATASIPGGSDRSPVVPTIIDTFHSAAPSAAASSARALRNDTLPGRTEPEYADGPATGVSVTTPALGEVSAAVTARIGATDRLNVHFTVEREGTAALIATGDGLDRALALAGATLESVSIEVRGERSPGGTADPRDAQAHARDAHADARQHSASRPPARLRAAAIVSTPASRRDRFA